MGCAIGVRIVSKLETLLDGDVDFRSMNEVDVLTVISF
jgi:hypothetical protein